MELKITKQNLSDGIQTVQNAISQKSSLPILGNVLLETDNSTLKLTATDLDIGICSIVPAEIISEGSITIPARKFFDIVRSFPEDSEISLSMKKNNFVNIRSGKAQFRIIGLPKEEFPLLPVFKDKDSIVIENSMLREMMNLTEFAVSKDDTRYVLNGMLFTIKGEDVCIAATDGRRLAVIRKKLPKKTLVDREVIIPTKTAQEVRRMLTEDGEVGIKFSDNQVLFSFPNSFILSRLIEGEYPNYRNVIPERTEKEIKVAREDFLSATRRASIFTDQDSLAVKLSIKKKKMTISKNTPYLGEAKEELTIDYSGTDEFEIGFNPKYLTDVLKNLPEDDIVLEVNDSSKPGVIRKGDNYTYVILPMQVTS